MPYAEQMGESNILDFAKRRIAWWARGRRQGRGRTGAGLGRRLCDCERILFRSLEPWFSSFVKPGGDLPLKMFYILGCKLLSVGILFLILFIVVKYVSRNLPSGICKCTVGQQ